MPELIVSLRELWRKSMTHAVRVALVDDVDMLEGFIGLAFLLRGFWMVYYQGLTVPVKVHEYIIPGWFTTQQWGELIIGIGIMQLMLSLFAYNRSGLRAATSTFGALLQGSGLNAYYAANQQWHGQVSFVILLVAGEMFIAFRAWHDLLRPRRRWTDG